MIGMHRIAIAAAGLGMVAVVGWRAAEWRSAAAEFDAAATARTEVESKALRAAALRELPPVAGFGARPAEDVIQLATRTLDAAGLPGARLRSVTPESDRAETDGEAGRRTVVARLSLEPLTVPELGAFLSAWRKGQQLWSVSRIELSAMQGGAGAHTAGQYRATITVAAPYIAEDSSNSNTPPPSFPPPPSSSAGAKP